MLKKKRKQTKAQEDENDDNKMKLKRAIKNSDAPALKRISRACHFPLSRNSPRQRAKIAVICRSVTGALAKILLGVCYSTEV